MLNGIRDARPDRWRGFRLLWTANLLNGLGSNLLWFALPLYVFQLTGQASAASTAFVVGSLPRLLVGPVGGIVADRVDRRNLLVWCNLLSAAVIAPMLTVREARLVWLLFACSFGDFLLSQLSNPAERALIPALAERHSLGRANALLASIDSFIRLAGPAPMSLPRSSSACCTCQPPHAPGRTSINRSTPERICWPGFASWPSHAPSPPSRSSISPRCWPRGSSMRSGSSG